jgi:hypothetical protein
VRGVQAAVAVLLARKASPALRTWPSAGGPPLTPADMAAAAGHAGLAALLAEAQLRELLAGLKSNSRRQGAHEVLTICSLAAKYFTDKHVIHVGGGSTLTCCHRLPFAALAAAAAAAKHEDDTSGQRKRTRAERSLYPGEQLPDASDAGPQADGLSAPERARRSAAALADAYDKVAQRRAVQKQRRAEQRQRCGFDVCSLAARSG